METPIDILEFPEGVYYVKVIDNVRQGYERYFSSPDPELSERAIEWAEEYKKAGGTVYLNRDRYNEVVQGIVDALYRKFETLRCRFLDPYDESKFKKIKKATQEIIDYKLASVIVVDEYNNVRLAFCVNSCFGLDYVYFENRPDYALHKWTYDYCRDLSTLCCLNFIRILGDGTLRYDNIIKYSESSSWFTRRFSDMEEPNAWNSMLGDLSKILQDDRYPNVKLEDEYRYL